MCSMAAIGDPCKVTEEVLLEAVCSITLVVLADCLYAGYYGLKAEQLFQNVRLFRFFF